MTAKSSETNLARHLQKRGKWNSYSSCLREVRKFTELPEWTSQEIKQMIDAGRLDPEEK